MSTATRSPAVASVPTRPEGLALGLWLTAACLLAIMALVGEVIPPALLLAVAMVGLGVLAVRSPARWVRWAGAGLPVVLLVLFGPFLGGDLAHPETPASFAPSFVLAVVALATAVTGVAAALGRPIGRRRTWMAAGLVVGAGIALTAVVGGQVTADVAQAGDVEVVAADVAYPEQVSVARGEALLLVNDDPIRHTFVVDGTVQELPGSTDRRVVVDLPVGEHPFICDVPGHEGMAGTLLVTDPT